MFQFNRKERRYFAKLVGPMMSIDSSGTFANLLTTSIWKGRNYVRQHVVPSNPKTDDQKAQRALFSAAVMAWQGLYSGTKESWNVAARDVYPPISGFNYYVAQYCIQAGPPTIPTVAPRKSKQIHGH